MLSKLGNFVFHYRNYLFPIYYLALFIPSSGIFNDLNTALIVGSIIISLGIIVRATTIGFVYIIRGGKNREIYAEKLVTQGVYSVCRNPMYLGNILLILGFAIFANSLLFLLVMFPLFCLFYMAIISAEEHFLISKFSKEYLAYKLDTNAILPKLSRLSSFHKGYKFSFSRVIKKEYNSIFMYVSGVFLLLLFHGSIVNTQFLVIIVALVMLYLWIKYLKRAGKLKE